MMKGRISLSTIALLVIVMVTTVITMTTAQLCTYRLPQKRNLATCQWYNSPDQSCCTYDDSVDMKNSWEKSAGAYKNATISQFITKVLADTAFRSCTQQLHMFLCFHCKPSQISYVSPNLNILEPKKMYNLRVCKSYCESMYGSCKNLPVDDGKLVRQKYGSANDFCTEFLAPIVSSYKITVTDDDNKLLKCFNSALPSMKSVRSTLIGTVLIALMYVLFIGM